MCPETWLEMWRGAWGQEGLYRVRRRAAGCAGEDGGRNEGELCICGEREVWMTVLAVNGREVGMTVVAAAGWEGRAAAMEGRSRAAAAVTALTVGTAVVSTR